VGGSKRKKEKKRAVRRLFGRGGGKENHDDLQYFLFLVQYRRKGEKKIAFFIQGRTVGRPSADSFSFSAEKRGRRKTRPLFCLKKGRMRRQCHHVDLP